MTVQSYQNGSISPVPTTEPGKLNTIVAEIGEIGFTGNLIPHAWYHHLKLSSGHTDLIGGTLLADIVYHYRPGVMRDEETGQPIHTFKRFARDKFCAPIAYFEKKFGLTKDQVRQGLKRLEEGGYIRREYRDIMVAGRWVRGMTFIEPVPERIRAITPQTRPDARPVPGAVQRPKATVVRQRCTSKDTGSAPEGAVSTPGGAVQIPPYKDTAKTPKETTTTPPTPSSDANAESGRWSCRQRADNQIPLPTPAEPINPSATTEEESRSLTVEPTSPPASESRVTPRDTPAVPTLEIPGESSTPAPAHTTPAPARATPAAHTTPLVFDFHLADLTPAQQAEFEQRLTRLPSPLAQAVLDEYNGAVGRKVQIRSKWGWLEFLIRAALDGRFIPTSDLAERRAAQAAAQSQAAAPNTPVSAPPARQPSAVWAAHKEELERLFPPVEVGINLSPLRATEDGHTLWLEAPNTFVVNWVRAHLPQIEAVLRPHTPLPIRVGIG